MAPLRQNKPDFDVAGQPSPLARLTPRQSEILRHIADGQNTKQLADVLHVSPKNH